MQSKKALLTVNVLLLTKVMLLFVNSAVAMYKTISIKQFGAKGDGKTNDTEAFQKAAAFINEKKADIILEIPYGIYIVGKQKKGKDYMLDGEDILFFYEVQNIQIVGKTKSGKRPVIKYANGLYFGSFNEDMTPKCLPTTNYFNKKTCAYIGACIKTFKCRNISIKNLEINGNQEKMNIGGFYGDKGRQLNHRGLYIINSNLINVSKVYLHHFALDGMELTSTSNTTLSNVISSYNGRQGLSWVGGEGLSANYCKFNYTGCSRILSAPGAGVDIEPENGKDIKNGIFTNCEFAYNKGCGIVNDRNKNIAIDFKFNKCKFVGYYNWAIWANGKNFDFYDCKIFGQVTSLVRSSDVTSTNEYTTFAKCYFSNIYNSRLVKMQTGYFFDLNGQKVIFDSCNFETYNIGFMWHGGIMPENKDLASQMKNSTINSNYDVTYHASISGINFINNTLNINGKGPANFLGISNKQNRFVLNSQIDKAKYGKVKPFVESAPNFICN